MKPGRDQLDRECAILHRYLARRAPDGYTAATYRRAHAELGALRAPGDWFDELLLRCALVHPWTMRIVQAYARLFAPAARVRQKAVLLLAIIECNPATLDCVQPSGRPRRARLMASTVIAMASFAAILVIGVLLLGPLHAAVALRARFKTRPQLLPHVPGKG